MRSGHNFLLEGPIDLIPTRLNCILQDLFRDTPLDHNAYYAYMGVYLSASTFLCDIFNQLASMFHLGGGEIKKVFFGPTYWLVVMMTKMKKTKNEVGKMKMKNLTITKMKMTMMI